MTELNNIWVQCMENNLDNTFQDWVPSLPVSCFIWSPPHLILQLQDCLPAWKPISTFSNTCKKTQQWILCPQAQECVVLIPTKYKDPHGWTDCVNGFIQDVKQTDMMYIVPVGIIVGQVYLVQIIASSGIIDSVWLGNNHMNYDTCWIV